MKLLQASFTAGELAPSLHSRVDLKSYATGCETLTNCFVHPHGGASNRTGFQYLGATKTASLAVKLIPFIYNTTDSYVLEFGNLYMRVWRDGGQVLDGGSPYEITTPYATADLEDLYYEQTNNLVVLTHPSYAPRELTRTDHDAWTISAITFSGLGDPVTGLYASPAGFDDYNTSVYYKVSYIDHNGLESEASAGLLRSVDRKWELGEEVILSWTAVNSISATISGASQTDPCVITATAHGFSNGNEAQISSVNGMEELNGNTYTIAGVTSNTFELLGVDATLYTAYTSGGVAVLPEGAKYYKVYKNDFGLYGLIGEREETYMRDDNISPDTSLGIWQVGTAFDSANNYPSISVFHQQRLLCAASNTNPLTFFGSVTGEIYNFNSHFPSSPDDGFEFTMDVDQAHAVRHMIEMRDLIIMTSGGIHVMTSGDKAFTTDNIRIKPQSFYGASKQKPIRIGGNVVYIQERGGKVRDLGYSFENDAFTGKDLSIMAGHLFDSHEIVDSAYAENPGGILWCVRDDGKMVGMTYLREHEIFAWHLHETDGLIENVSVVPEADTDAVYIVVARTIDGSTVRYVERLHCRDCTALEDAFFVDSGLSYDGTATSTVTGLDHLEGETVVALADGLVETGLTVSSGSVTLSTAASKIHVGLSYNADIKTLEPPVELSDGTGVTRRKSISAITIRTEHTMPFLAGSTADTLVSTKSRGVDVWGDITDLYAGDIEMIVDTTWSQHASMFIRQDKPLPMTILAIIPNVEIGN